jgi:1-acyl-sn-glycerol-3-phosphate acyltransferase
MSIEFKYTPASDLHDPLPKRLGNYPRQRDLTWDTLRWLGRWLVVGSFRLQYRLGVTGSIPQGKKVAIVANHQSHLDTVTLLAALPPEHRCRLVVLAAEDYFFLRLGRAMVASLLAQAVSFNRLERSALRDWRNRLINTEAGWLIVYPSGSRNGQHLQRGLLKLLFLTGWTIAPVRLEGTRAAWPPTDRFWRPFKTLGVNFLAPYEGNDFEGLLTHLHQVLGQNEDSIADNMTDISVASSDDSQSPLPHHQP